MALSYGRCSKFLNKSIPNVPSSRDKGKQIIDRKNGANVKLCKKDIKPPAHGTILLARLLAPLLAALLAILMEIV